MIGLNLASVYCDPSAWYSDRIRITSGHILQIPPTAVIIHASTTGSNNTLRLKGVTYTVYLFLRLVLYANLLAVLHGCATPPAQRFTELALHYGLQTERVAGLKFSHQVFFANLDKLTATRRLHVYLGGDGTPWRGPNRPSIDPTPRRALLLEMMTSDAQARIYLGRPCYHGMARPPCNWIHWTMGRYSQQVVQSMVAALQTYIKRHAIETIVLIGYSGGGTLAMLMAPHITQTTQVVTLAANLDVQAWTHHHNTTSLVDWADRTTTQLDEWVSLNPATQAPLASRILQYHYFGELDKQVPPHLIIPSLARQPNAQWRIIEGFDHRCCWVHYWPNILRQTAIQ